MSRAKKPGNIIRGNMLQRSKVQHEDPLKRDCRKKIFYMLPTERQPRGVVQSKVLELNSLSYKNDPVNLFASVSHINIINNICLLGFL